MKYLICPPITREFTPSSRTAGQAGCYGNLMLLSRACETCFFFFSSPSSINGRCGRDGWMDGWMMDGEEKRGGREGGRKEEITI